MNGLDIEDTESAGAPSISAAVRFIPNVGRQAVGNEGRQ